MISRTQALAVVRRNLKWFTQSGVMRPQDGFWGVAERLAITEGNPAADKMLSSFPCYSRLGAGVVAMEHRRADCCVQTAWLFDLAADALKRPALRAVADNILAYLTQRSGLRQRDSRCDTFGLWGWSNPVNSTNHWTDDNSWVVMLLLKLAENGRPDLKPLAIQTARAMHRHVGAYFGRLKSIGFDNPGKPTEGIPMNGLLLNPHWLGLSCMALSNAAAADPDFECRDVIDAYFPMSLKGPPASQRVHLPLEGLKRPWPLSEYAYLGLAASVVALQMPGRSAEEAALSAGRELIERQFPDGHFPSEHGESPTAPHLADMIYTENWAVLALLHLHAWSGDAVYSDAARRSLEFLARIQDATPDRRFKGCWRGMFDTQSGAWGGGDRFEGGANSIYSGWTNAPISLAFLFNSGTGSLFADHSSLI